MLDSEGTPTIVEQVLVAPPESQIGPLSEEERKERFSSSPISGVYEEMIDRESAFELLKKREEELRKTEEAEEEAEEKESFERKAARKPKGRSRQGMGEAFFKSMMRSVGSSMGRRVIRGLLGSMKR